MDKDSLIEWLIKDDINTIQVLLEGNDSAYLDSILREGFVGYNHQTEEELRTEYNNRKA